MESPSEGADRSEPRTVSADRLIRWACEAGFDAAGIASIEESHHAAAYRQWLAAGRHAGMAYLERRLEARLDPRHLLDGVASVLCVALRYAPLDGAPTPDNDLWPRVARYAQGRDYHDVMVRRLRFLSERIVDAHPEIATRWYVDTGPVLERELAARAGLGVVGKNTCLLHREMGSYFLLGELFLTTPLPASEPLTDLCGKCTLCLEACPTDAFVAPYQLDANRCISYWTIEERGPWPDEARGMVGDWVFGCDICQEVCPWNRRRLEPAHHPELELPDTRRDLDLLDLLLIDREGYVEAFRGSPMKRAKQAGLQRNAAAAMGNRGDRRYVAGLLQTLRQHDEVMVRAQAAWSLGRIGGDQAQAGLEERHDAEETTVVREEIAASLRRIAATTT